jgi:hypothetical protein
VIVKHVPREAWEKVLRDFGCSPLEGKGKLNTAEWWKGPRGVFTVPVEADGASDYWSVRRFERWLRGELAHPYPEGWDDD